MSESLHPGYLITPLTKNFRWYSPTDVIACPQTGLVRPSVNFLETMEAIQALRQWYRGMLTIVSGFRCPEYNQQMEGAADSQHLLSLADLQDDRFGVDLVPSLLAGVVPPRAHPRDVIGLVARKAEAMGFTGIGLYDKYLHLDRRRGPREIWDERT